MQQNFTQPPNLPPVRTRRVRVAGQDFDIPDVQWLRDLVSSTQTWALASHNSQQINQVWRGPDIVSAATITVSYPFHVVTGSAAISTISAIATFSGGVVYLLNGGGTWTLTTGGNISTAYVPNGSTIVCLVYDAITQTWFPEQGGAFAIGSLIVGGTANDVLFVGPSGTLAQDDNFQWIAASGLHLKKALNMESGADLVLGSGSLVTTYDGVATVSSGIPAEYAAVDLTGQTAAISATTLYAVPAAGAGMYRVSFYGKITTAASVSSTLGPLTITATDPADSVVATVPGNAIPDMTSSINNSTATGVISGAVTVYAKASTNIQYAVAYASNAAGMAFDLHLKCERL